MMHSTRDWVLFFAGASASHALTHLALGQAGVLPLTLYGFELTPHLNMMATVVGFALTGILLWSSCRCK